MAADVPGSGDTQGGEGEEGWEEGLGEGGTGGGAVFGM